MKYIKFGLGVIVAALLITILITIQNKITSLETKINNIPEQVSYETEIDRLNAYTNELQAQYEDLLTRINKLSSEIGKTNTANLSKFESVSEAITQVQSKLDNTTNRVNRIYEIVGEPNVYNYSSFKWFMTKED